MPCGALDYATNVCNPAREVGPARDDLGVGLNATFVSGKCGLIDNLNQSTSFGLAAHTGADWKITDKTNFNVDLEYVDISTDVGSDGTKIGTAEIILLACGLGIVWRF